jgi:hypothetical protein
VVILLFIPDRHKRWWEKPGDDAIYFQDLAHEFAADCRCMLGARCDRRVRWAYSAYCRRAEKDSAFMVAIARIGSDNGSELTSNAILNLG